MGKINGGHIGIAIGCGVAVMAREGYFANFEIPSLWWILAGLGVVALLLGLSQLAPRSDPTAEKRTGNHLDLRR